jgi:uncharacterized protein
MGAAENKAAVAAVYAAFGQGDVASVFARIAPDAVWVFHGANAAPFSGEHKGLEQIKAFYALVADSLEFTGGAHAPIAAEGDVVVAMGEQNYTVKKTGKAVSALAVHVFTFGPDGKIVRFEEWEADASDAWS